jgi:outer membrane protein OmpA-like peptidoglycan-associated protein
MKFLFALSFFISFGVLGQQVVLEKSCFNTNNDEFGARVFNGQLFVVSSPVISDKVSGASNQSESSNLFIVDSCNLKLATLLSAKHGAFIELSSLRNDGPISGSDSLLFITVNHGKASLAKLGIFYSILESGGWSELIPFPLNDINYNVTHPYYDAQSKVLYFVSDALSNGNLDISAVEFSKSGMGERVFLPGLNSDKNDFFPYFQDGKLYFSSNRAGGIGGYDLYSYDGENTQLMPGDFNSIYDDVSIAFLDSTTGFFSSNRESLGKIDHVYSFSIIPDEDLISVNEPQILSAEELIKNEIVDVYGRLIFVVDSIRSSNTNFQLLGIIDAALKNVNIKMPEGLNDLSLSQLEVLRKTFTGAYDVLATSIANSLSTANQTNTNVAAFNELIGLSKVEQIQFPFDKYQIPEEYKKILQSIVQILGQNSSLELYLEGHTDNVGSREYNYYLSMMRVKAVQAFFVQNGIDSKRLHISHFGPDKPIADNKTLQGRFANRRVSIVIK